jgi:hypothetical protein
MIRFLRLAMQSLILGLGPSRHWTADQDIPNAKLYPGMLATVTIRTIERTAFDYVVGPLTMSFNGAFQQR